MSLWGGGGHFVVLLGLLWVRAGLAAGAGLVAGMLVRRRSPAMRSVIYRATFVSVLVAALLPAAPRWMPGQWRLPALSTAATPALPGAWGEAMATSAPASSAPQPGREPERPAEEEAQIPARATSIVPAHPRSGVLDRAQPLPFPEATGQIGLASVLAGMWLVGALLLLLRALGGALRIWRVIATSQPAGDEASAAVGEAAVLLGVRPPEVRLGNAPVPFVVGVRRPVILLPKAVCDHDGDLLRPVLLHELTHVRRRDCAFGWLSLIVCIALWPQPLIWALAHAAERASEEACDAAVVAAGCPKKQYASCLVELAASLGRTSQALPVNAAVRRRSSLTRRVEAIMGSRPPGSPRPVALVVATVGVMTTAVAIAACAGTRSPAPGGDPQPILALLNRDPRLAVATVSLKLRDRPLGEVTGLFSKRLGVMLSASRATSDDRVTLLVDRRPAAETLARIAVLFGFRWQATKDGYQLVDPAEHRRSEELLREDELRWQLAEIRAEMARRPRFASAAHDWLEAQRQQDQTLHEHLEDTGTEADQERRRSDLEREMSEIDEVLDPRRATCLAIAGSLRPAQLRELLDGGEVRLSEVDGSLTPVESRAIRTCFAHQQRYDSGEIRAGWGGAPDRNRMALQTGLMLHEFESRVLEQNGSRPRIPEIYPAGAVVRLEDPAGEHPSPGDRRNGLRLSVRLIGGDRPIDWEFEGATWEPELETQPGYDETDPLLRRPVEIRAPETGPETARIDDYYGNTNWPESWVPLSELLRQVHEQTGLDILSDSFARVRLDPALVSRRMRVGELLDRLAARFELRWERDGDLILLRNARAYRDRVEAVPERVLGPWRARVRRAGAADLDALSELCGRLTDAQLRGLSRDWGWYLRGVPASWSPFYANRRHLRFWESLAPAQRRACRQQYNEQFDLFRGAPILPFAMMSPTQKRDFAYASAAAGSPSPLGFRLDDGSPIPGASYSFHYYFQGTTEPEVSAEIQLIRGRLPE